MEKRKSPNGFIVVLPGEIIEIPQDSDKSWICSSNAKQDSYNSRMCQSADFPGFFLVLRNRRTENTSNRKRHPACIC